LLGLLTIWGSRGGTAVKELTDLPIVAIYAHPYNDRCDRLPCRAMYNLPAEI